MIKSFLILLFIITVSCSGLDDAKKVLTNQKTKTTDEFLVKKNESLSQPPDYQNLPTPDSLKNPVNKNNSDELSLKKIMNQKSDTSTKKSNKSLEQSILNEIRK